MTILLSRMKRVFLWRLVGNTYVKTICNILKVKRNIFSTCDIVIWIRAKRIFKKHLKMLTLKAFAVNYYVLYSQRVCRRGMRERPIYLLFAHRTGIFVFCWPPFNLWPQSVCTWEWVTAPLSEMVHTMLGISHSEQPRLKYIFHLEYGNHVCRIIIIIIIIIAESSALVVCFFGASVIRKPAAEEALCSSGFVRKAKGEPFLCRAARRIFCVLLSAHWLAILLLRNVFRSQMFYLRVCLFAFVDLVGYAAEN